MNDQTSQRPFSQRQLRVGELVKQNLGELFLRNEAKIPSINSKLIPSIIFAILSNEVLVCIRASLLDLVPALKVMCDFFIQIHILFCYFFAISQKVIKMTKTLSIPVFNSIQI